MTELEHKDWIINHLKDNINSSHKLLVHLLQDIGVGNGEVGWIEHGDEDEVLKRDSLYMDGELIFGFEAISYVLKQKDEEIAKLNSAIEEITKNLKS